MKNALQPQCLQRGNKKTREAHGVCHSSRHKNIIMSYKFNAILQHELYLMVLLGQLREEEGEKASRRGREYKVVK